MTYDFKHLRNDKTQPRRTKITFTQPQAHNDVPNKKHKETHREWYGVRKAKRDVFISRLKKIERGAYHISQTKFVFSRV